MSRPYLDAILKLQIPDRLDLVVAIWDSLADSPQGEAVFALTDEQRAELDRPLAERLADPASAIPWAEATPQRRGRRIGSRKRSSSLPSHPSSFRWRTERRDEPRSDGFRTACASECWAPEGT